MVYHACSYCNDNVNTIYRSAVIGIEKFRQVSYISHNCRRLCGYVVEAWFLHRALNSDLSFSGCPGVFKALLVSIGGHTVQAEEPQPAKCHPAAVLWTVLLRNCVRKVRA